MMNVDGTYHRDLGLPKGAAERWAGHLSLRYGSHAQLAAESDRYGKLPLPEVLDFEPGDVVEVTVEGGKAVKAVLRFPLDDAPYDLVLVAERPEAGTAFVKTVWANLASDKHNTRNRAAYRRVHAPFAVN
jgi:hypothetical protein